MGNRGRMRVPNKKTACTREETCLYRLQNLGHWWRHHEMKEKQDDINPANFDQILASCTLLDEQGKLCQNQYKASALCLLEDARPL
jgi:hypothetical protein